MYFAGNIVNRSMNGGASWTAISPDLTGGDPFPGPDEPYPFGTVTTLAVGQSDGNELYAGTDDARLWYTRNLGGNWTQASDPDLPARWVTDVAVDPPNADVAYVTYTGFYEGENTPYVLRTDDGGATWTDITGNLPAGAGQRRRPRSAGKAAGRQRRWRVAQRRRRCELGSRRHGAADGPGDGPARARADGHAVTPRPSAAACGRRTYPCTDADGDGIPDAGDNCTEVANPTQCDTNDDGYGNACDADIDNSGIVNFAGPRAPARCVLHDACESGLESRCGLRLQRRRISSPISA